MICQRIGEDIILKVHDFISVESRNWHSFEALEDTELIEIYDQDDNIIREQQVT